MCCGPCSVYPLKELRNEGMDVEGFFYNPNIHPYEEYQARRENVLIFSELSKLRVNAVDDFRQQQWEAFNGPEVERCTMCYAIRLNKAAEFAAENGYDAFTTTLLVSPYQKHELVKEIGEKAASKHGVEFLYRDFRPGFRQGQREAKEMNLYRQKFCGCIISKRLQNG
jgi:predicted adenine nucleotide alpha hydrolase (AANH) superfamily ATPase